jgi:acyl-CoA synthetase (NDP forming)
VSLGDGDVGIVSQSGGLGLDILHRGQNLGLRFSGLVTLGNSIDVDPTDLLEFYLTDSATRVIGLYIEDPKDGRRLQRIARQYRGTKPIVVLLGGVSVLGRKAAASHTGAMGSSYQAWQALARQTGLILTRTLDAFLDALQVCTWLRPGRSAAGAAVTLIGNGGGAGVLATDALAEAGLQLAVPTERALSEYSDLKLPPGASFENPIDIPASVLKEDQGRIIGRVLEINRKHAPSYATLIHLNLPVIMGYRHIAGFLPNLAQSIAEQALAGKACPHTLLVLRSDRSEQVEQSRRDRKSVV